MLLQGSKDFEKTLYDNALLAEAYVEFYQVSPRSCLRATSCFHYLSSIHKATHDQTWSSVVRGILDYVIENLEDKSQGGYFTSGMPAPLCAHWDVNLPPINRGQRERARKQWRVLSVAL